MNNRQFTPLFFFLLFLLTAREITAQKIKFQEGFIVTTAGDTLKGYVYWKKTATAEDSLLFKAAENETPRPFAWDGLTAAYNRENRQSLKICKVTRNLEYIDANDYMIRHQDSVTVQVIPLTELYKGRRLSLYEYYDKSPFYFLYDGKDMLQLIQKYRYLNRTERMFDWEKGRRFEITDVYRGLLASYYNFFEDKKMRYILDNTLYEAASLKTLVSKMDKKL